MEISRSYAGPAKHLSHQLNFLELHVLNIPERIHNFTFKLSSKLLGQKPNLIESMYHITEFPTSKRMNDGLNPGHQHLMNDLGASIWKYKRSAQFLDVLGIEVCNVLNHVLFDIFE